MVIRQNQFFVTLMSFATTIVLLAVNDYAIAQEGEGEGIDEINYPASRLMCRLYW